MHPVWLGCLPMAGWGLMPSGPATGLLLCLPVCRQWRPRLCLLLVHGCTMKRRRLRRLWKGSRRRI
ncbi:hypothetical protein I7I51_04167 [Histoplasma capsulatum]|uniref:Uncharacterized protein n=1 Tax=Ajellomyces capsulatus TaxID=5037 RepID=A0A8A1M9R8_AJECA|nr:hypothetical protein I7I51_04167 [Histoplasma capsulatum]